MPSAVFEILLLAALGLACWKLGRSKPAQLPAAVSPRGLVPALATLLSIVLAADLLSFFHSLSENPHGEWDAWAIWNLHARFLSTPYWRELFSPAIPWTHPDYPLLLPGFIARVWTVLGERDPNAPAAVAFVFTFAAIGLLGGTIAALRGRVQGLLAALVLASTPYFIARGAAEYADTPVAFFILATLALLSLEDRRWPARRGLSILAGICACMAAWTKNEGLLLIALLVPLRVALIWRARGRAAALRQLTWFAAGLAPVLALLLLFKLTLATTNANIGGHSAADFAHLLADTSRWQVVIVEMGKGILRFGGLPVGTVPVLAAYTAWVGIDRGADRVSLFTLSAALVLLLVGYCFVFVVSPGEIHWQTDNAVGRLLLQLWPATVFLAFLLANRLDRPAPDAHGDAAGPPAAE